MSYSVTVKDVYRNDKKLRKKSQNSGKKQVKHAVCYSRQVYGFGIISHFKLQNRIIWALIARASVKK